MSALALESADAGGRPVRRSALARWLAAWRRRRAQHRTVMDLMHLSPHLRADLGIDLHKIAGGRSRFD